MSNKKSNMSEDEIDNLFEHEFISFMDRPFVCSAPNRESRERYLRIEKNSNSTDISD